MTGSMVASIVFNVTVVAALALATARLSLRSRASVRHALLAAAFAAILMVPLAALFPPPVRVDVPLVTRPSATVPIAESAAVFPIADGSASETSAASGSAPQSLRLPLQTLAVAGWLVGALILLLRLAVALWRTRTLRRSATPWPDGQSVLNAIATRDGGNRLPVNLLLHEGIRGPLTCGVVHHAILLPADAVNWSDDDLGRAIAHEHEHVRRSDWLTQVVARAVTACYWFHPLVWHLKRALTLEAERACDDAVLRGAEPTAYATQLVTLAQRLADSTHLPLLAMANRRELPARVHALLDSRQRRGPAGAASIAGAFAIAATLVASMSSLRIVAAAQPQSTLDPRAFDVASVKPCDELPPATGGQRRLEYTVTPGRVVLQCLTVERIIFFAYAGIGNLTSPLLNSHSSDEMHIRGGPSWMRSDRFTIAATAEGVDDPRVMMGPMLRAVLEDRFKLRTHRELEEAPMYALTVAPSGLKIEPIAPDGCTPISAAQNLSVDAIVALDRGDKPTCGNFTSTGNGVNRRWSLGGDSLTKFANQTLSAVLDRYVIDQTNVSGLFNIQLEFAMDESIKTGVFGGRAVNPTARPDIEPAPSIFTALEEQLGLKLERTRGPREFLVIDRVARPEPN